MIFLRKFHLTLLKIMNEILNSINYAFQDCIEFIETNKDIAAVIFFVIVCIITIVFNAVVKDVDDYED